MLSARTKIRISLSPSSSGRLMGSCMFAPGERFKKPTARHTPSLTPV